MRGHKNLDGKFTESEKETLISLAQEGKAVITMMRAIGAQSTNFWRKLNGDVAFKEAFEAARRDGLEMHADYLLNFPENADLNLVRLRSDNIKWVLSRLSAARFGDKIDLTMHHNIDILGALSAARQRVNALTSPPEKHEIITIEKVVDDDDIYS